MLKKQLAKGGPESATHRILEDNDLTGYKSNAGEAAKADFRGKCRLGLQIARGLRRRQRRRRPVSDRFVFPAPTPDYAAKPTAFKVERECSSRRPRRLARWGRGGAGEGNSSRAQPGPASQATSRTHRGGRAARKESSTGHESGRGRSRRMIPQRNAA